MFLSLRGTQCRGNLGGAVARVLVPALSSPAPSTEIASLPWTSSLAKSRTSRSQRQRGVAEIASLRSQRQRGVSKIASSLCAPGNERRGAPRNDQNVTCSATF